MAVTRASSPPPQTHVNHTQLRKSPQAVSLATTVFVNEFDQKTELHRVRGDTEVRELVEWDTEILSGKMVGMRSTMTEIGTCDGDTVRCCGRFTGGAC